MVEMIETANILHHATRRSLLVLWTRSGAARAPMTALSIAWAVAEHMHNHPSLGAKTVFATHYHELVQLAEHLPRVRNFNVAVVEEGGTVRLLHHIAPGGADKSYGIHVARLAGLPRAVVARAQDVLDRLEEQSAGRKKMESPRRVDPGRQLGMFERDLTMLKELGEMDVDALTPLEAIAALYALRERARRALGGATGT